MKYPHIINKYHRADAVYIVDTEDCLFIILLGYLWDNGIILSKLLILNNMGHAVRV